MFSIPFSYLQEDSTTNTTRRQTNNVIDWALEVIIAHLLLDTGMRYGAKSFCRCHHRYHGVTQTLSFWQLSDKRCCYWLQQAHAQVWCLRDKIKTPMTSALQTLILKYSKTRKLFFTFNDVKNYHHVILGQIAKSAKNPCSYFSRSAAISILSQV